MPTEKNLQTRNGALWVQPDGPNTQAHYIGCVTVDALEEPKGETELVQCMSPDGSWETKGELGAKPEPVVTTVSQLLFPSASYLEELENNFTLFLMQTSGSRVDIFTNYVRGSILNNCKVTNRSDTDLIHREEETASSLSLEISAWPPVMRVGKMVLRRNATSVTRALQDIFMFYPTEGAINPKKWEYGLVGGEGDVAAAPDCQLSTDEGRTWVDSAVLPLAVDDDIASVNAVIISGNIVRKIVAKLAPVGAQGEIAYSDDDGATWTTVSIGGAVAGHGALAPGALWAKNMHFVWLASAAGYIYKSEDGGGTWVAKSEGDTTTEDLKAIVFSDEDNGMAVGANDAILITSNGGETWQLAESDTGTGDNLLCLDKAGDYWWIGTDGGELYYSYDDGDTWTVRAGFTYSGLGSVPDLSFLNEMVGFMIVNNSSVGYIMRTIDGGHTWEVLDTPLNAELNALHVGNENTIFAVGEPESGTAVIIEGTRD